MKNILILKFPYSSSFGGGEYHTLMLAQELKKLGINFYLAASCPVLLEKFRERNWPTQKIWAPPEPVAKWSLLLFPLLALPMFFILLTILIHYRFNRRVRGLYCLSLTEKILATWPARILGMKVFWMEHVGFKRWLTSNPLRFFYRLFSNQATIIVISQALKQQLLLLGVKEKAIKVIYNGFDFAYYQKLRAENQPRPRDRFVIGTACRLVKEKGVEYLLLAVQKASEIVPNLRLIIVGEGVERKRLEWLAKNLKIDRFTQFVGFQQEVDKWIRDFDIFVLPSVGRESFGNVLVEALALERPVIASAIEGTPEIIQSQQTGLLVKPGNSDELAQAIIYLYQNSEIAHQLAQAGCEFVENNFPMEKMIMNFFHLFKTIAE